MDYWIQSLEVSIKHLLNRGDAHIGLQNSSSIPLLLEDSNSVLWSTILKLWMVLLWLILIWGFAFS